MSVCGVGQIRILVFEMAPSKLHIRIDDTSATQCLNFLCIRIAQSYSQLLWRLFPSNNNKVVSSVLQNLRKKMFITDNKKDFYEVLVKARLHVLIFVSHDLDSLTAAKIVRYILECEHIQHTIIPIRSILELQRSYQEHRDSVKFVLLINIGATIDVLDLLVPEPDVKIFIADYHRPLNIHNVYYDQNVYILFSISDLHYIEDELSSIPKYEELFWEDDIDDDDVDVRNLTLEQLKKRNEFKQFEANRKRLMLAYEEHTYNSYSTSTLFFDLAWKLAKDSNELLWLAILPVADKCNMFKLNETYCRKETVYIQNSMLRLKNIKTDRGFVLNTLAHTDNDSQGGELITTTNNLDIYREKDLNLKLYREWSLYESLRHTMYTSCKFKVWKLRGYKRLHIFLADLGLPLRQCKEKYKSMDLSLKTNLQEKIDQMTEKYGLSNLIGESFVGSRGFKQKFCANDLAAATRALLESSDKNKSYNSKFFDAYDSLSWNNSELIQTGLTLARVQLISIVKQVQLIIDAHLISSMNNVLWYVIIPEGTPDITLFCHPGCLKYLSIYTLHAFGSINSKSHKSLRLPLVMVTPDPDRPGIGIVCGVSPLMALSHCKTFFKQAYLNASRRMINITQDWNLEESIVDPDIVYIPYAHRIAFLNELSLLLEST